MSEPPINPEQPEPELSWEERRAERKRLRAVRAERRRQIASNAKGRMNRSMGKDRKKAKKGK